MSTIKYFFIFFLLQLFGSPQTLVASEVIQSKNEIISSPDVGLKTKQVPNLEKTSKTYELISSNSLVIRDFSNSRLWKFYLHMRSGKFEKFKSRIKKESKFFFSKEGYHDPEKELIATLENFYQPHEFIKKWNMHPACMFPARWTILQKIFQLDSIEKLECAELNVWRKQLNSENVVLVYASQYMSNPSSMMGHTFLKFFDPSKQDYLNSSIGYAAVVEDNVGPFDYVFSGLFGGFVGRFSRELYYEKVHEYNNMEQRDLWEFSLKMTEAEKNILIDHLWELKTQAQFNYYFTDENCSYLILAAIQVTKPDEDLLLNFPLYVVPAETIKNLKKSNLIESIKFRPSIWSTLKFKYDNLSNSSKKKLVQNVNSLTEKDLNTALELETALDKIELERQIEQGKLSKELQDYEKKLLIKRAKLGAYNLPPQPEPPSILDSHYPMHIEFGAGQSSLEKNYSLFTFRPAVHKFTDRDNGYLKNSSLNLLETQFKMKSSLNDLYLSRLIFVESGVTNPYEKFNPAKAWRMRLQYLRETQPICVDCRLFEFEISMGAAFREFSETFDLVPLLYFKGQTGSEIPRGRLWLGPQLEFIFTPNNNWKWRQIVTIAREFKEFDGFQQLVSQSEIRRYGIFERWDLGFGFLARFNNQEVPNDQEASIRLIHDF